jgi:glutamyl-tRNA reductase
MEKVHWRTGKSKNGKVKFNVTSLLGISCEEQNNSDNEDEERMTGMEFFEDMDYQSFMNLVELMRNQGQEISDEQAEELFETLRKNQEEKHIKKMQQKQKIIDHIGKDFTQAVSCSSCSSRKQTETTSTFSHLSPV